MLMGRKALHKGLRFEATVARKFRDAGFSDAARLGTGRAGDNIVGPLLIECEHRANPSIRRKLKQCEQTIETRAILTGRIPAVVSKKNGDSDDDAIFAMRLGDLLRWLGPHADKVAPW